MTIKPATPVRRAAKRAPGYVRKPAPLPDQVMRKGQWFNHDHELLWVFSLDEESGFIPVDREPFEQDKPNLIEIAYVPHRQHRRSCSA
jgi:hypothetical protein